MNLATLVYVDSSRPLLLRADSGFAREALMAWCEANAVDYGFGLARNERLEGRIADALDEARLLSQANAGQPARAFRDFEWSTKESWSRRRRVIGKAEWTGGEANPRFLVTSTSRFTWECAGTSRLDIGMRQKQRQLPQAR